MKSWGELTSAAAGPFELTKLSAQVSVLLSDRKNCPEPGCYAVAKSYQNKGTFKTLTNIVKHRGFPGLYTGFKLHLCTLSSLLRPCLQGEQS